MNKVLTVGTALLIALGAVFSVAQAADDKSQGEKMHKAVYHLNSKDVETQKDVLRNSKNHISATGKDKTDLRIVMHAGGVSMLRAAKDNQELKSQIDDLKLSGVKFVVCKKTLERGKIDFKKDLYDVSEKDIVPSGVAEIAILQEKGYSYVKP